MKAACFLTLIVLGLLPSSAIAETLGGHATVVDGDTIKIAGQNIDLMFIDAPELDQICHVPYKNEKGKIKIKPGSAFKGGLHAAEKLTELIQGQSVTCSIYRWERTKQDDRIYYNEKISGVDFEVMAKHIFGHCTTSSGLNLSLEMAKQGMANGYTGGYATTLFILRNGKINRKLKKFSRQIDQAVKAALQNEIGIHSGHPFFPNCHRPTLEQRKGKFQ